MDSYSGTLQWYQSRRSSAAHQKIEKEIEMETTGSDFLPLCRDDKSPKTFDEKLSLALKRIDELIERNKKSSQKMIADDFSPGNPVSTDPQKIGCEEALIEESSMSTDGDESQQFVEAGAVLDSQVSLQTKNSKSYKKYTHYRAVELDDRRERGLCLWCDEFWYIGHECCEKKLYVYEIDIEEDLAVSVNNLMKPLVDEKLVEVDVFHCDEHLVENCVANDSNALGNITCGVGIEKWESSEAMCKNYSMGNHELKVFEGLLENDALENVAENSVILFGRIKLWLDDVGCGKLMATMFKNHSPSVIEALFSLLSRLGGLHKPWIALPELPLPPPEPPPRTT